MNTGITNSSEDYKEINKMGLTPASDKASKMSDREAVSAGLKKNTMPEKEVKYGKNRMDRAPKDGFTKGSKGK